MKKRLLVVCLPMLALALAAGCARHNAGKDNSKDVASLHGSATPSATPSLSFLEQGRRHAQCMRDHGVPEADPRVQPNGDWTVGGGYDKHTLDQGVLDKAIEACKPYTVVLPADVLALKLAGARDLAKCMRDHGVANYPDPDPNDLGKSLPDSVRDDPHYEQANDICNTRGASSTPAATRS
jgi:hypothetical protein